MATFRRACLGACFIAACSTLVPGTAGAEVGFALHGEGFAARMVGERKAEQFGWGGGGWLAPELSLGGHVGIDLPVGGLGLADADGGEAALGLEEPGAGYAVFAMPSIRVRPFGRAGRGGVFDAAGFWIAGGGGAAFTGGLLRPAVNVRLGYDLFAAHRVRFGPTAGFVQIVETTSEVIPQDARLVLFGLHAALEKTQPRIIPDRDGDGIPDEVDKCPDAPEDRDGFEDEDGCPDIDNDQDGVLDKVDSCPDAPEDADGFEDLDGCPDRDNDDDGILDSKDKCPDIPEDRDEFEDEDGCPDLDNDQDGFPDNVDKCPNDPETVNNYADDDGCPDEKLVRVRGDEILLDERVYFPVNGVRIQPRSWLLLKTVAKLLRNNPQFERVRVQGHADERGEASFNEQLSLRRGKSVREFLVRMGVAGERLVVEAYGESRPVRDGSYERAWRKNRRVELRIIQRAKLVPASVAPKKPVEEEAPPESDNDVPATTDDAPASASPEASEGKPAPDSEGATKDTKSDAPVKPDGSKDADDKKKAASADKKSDTGKSDEDYDD